MASATETGDEHAHASAGVACGVTAMLAAMPPANVDALFGTDTFTYTFRDLETTVTITAGTGPGRA